MVRDSEVQAEQLKSIVVQLLRDVRDNNLRNSKLIDDILSNKIFGVSLSDFGERFCFYPLVK